MMFLNSVPLKRWALLAILITGLAAWFWTRFSPWVRAQRHLDRGDPAAAAEILHAALDKGSLSPEREEALLELLVEADLKAGALDNAERECRRLREKFPRNFSAALGLGIINLAHDRLSFAAEHLESARDIAPDDLRPSLFLSQVRLAQGDYPRAAQVLAGGLARFPGQADLLEKQGDLAFDQGLYQEALAHYGDVLRLSPEDRDTLRKLAQALMYAGDLETARNAVERARQGTEDFRTDLALAGIWSRMGRTGEAEALCEKIYRADQNRLEAGVSWAYMLGRRGENARADEILTEIGGRLPPLRPDREQTWTEPHDWNSLEQAYWGRVVARRRHLDYEIARTHLEIHRARYTDARIHVERALALDSSNAGVLLLLSDLARRQGDDAARLKWLEKAVSLYQGHPGALLARGWAYLDLGRTSDAVVDAKLVGDAYPRLASAQALLSRAHLLIGRGKDALIIARRAVSLNPGDADARLALALAEAAGGDNAAAESDFIAALEVDPFSAEARAAYGRFLKSHGRPLEAAKQIDEATRLEPFVLRRKKAARR